MRYNDISGKNLATILESDAIAAYHDPAGNQLAMAHADDIRKPKLTLRMLNKLKKLRATNELENVKKESLLSVMYGASPDEDSEF